MLAVHKNSTGPANPRHWSRSAGSLPTAQLGFKLGHHRSGVPKQSRANTVFRTRALKRGAISCGRDGLCKRTAGKRRSEVSQGDQSAFCRSEKSVAVFCLPPSLAVSSASWAVLPPPLCRSSSRVCWRPQEQGQRLPQLRHQQRQSLLPRVRLDLGKSSPTPSRALSGPPLATAGSKQNSQPPSPTSFPISLQGAEAT